MNKLTSILCCIGFISGTAFTQNINDLVRFSNVQMHGSARFEAMAGSFGALGAEISSGLINPAGYGRYSSSQFNFTMQNNRFQNSTLFNDTRTMSEQNTFRPSSAGFVFVNDISHKNNGFMFNQIGLTYNRVENFHNTISYTGNQFLSILDAYAGQAAGYSFSELNSFFPFSTNMAWETYAIDEGPNLTFIPRLSENATTTHSRTIGTTGGINEYAISFSGNYLNKLYIGANWGIRNIRYNENITHNETYLNNESESLNSIQITEYLETKGVGHNLKIGAIYLPTEFLRLGIAAHTPTYYELTDQFGANMIANHKPGSNPGGTVQLPNELVPTGNYKYRLRTPGRVIGSAAYVFSNRGAINVDLEYVDYRWANLKTTKDQTYAPTNYTVQNRQVDTTLRSVLNIRVGGELVFQSQYFIRGGIGYYGQPYRSDLATENTKATVILSGGAGIKLKRSSIDVAYRRTNRNFSYFAFAESETSVNSQKHGFVITYALQF